MLSFSAAARRLFELMKMCLLRCVQCGSVTVVSRPRGVV